MKRRRLHIVYLVLLLFVAAQPAFAAEGESVFLPGWFAWMMVALSLILPTAILLYLRKNGRF